MPPKICFSYYTISKGYRKVPGNQCVGGVKYDPIIIPCPNTGLFGSVGLIIFLILFAILIMLIITAFNKNFFNILFEFINVNNNAVSNLNHNNNINSSSKIHKIETKSYRVDFLKTDYIEIEKEDISENNDDQSFLHNDVDRIYNGSLRVINRNNK